MSVDVLDPSSGRFTLFEIKRTWVEGQATWKVYATGKNWQLAGARGATDRGGAALGSLSAAQTGVATLVLKAEGIALVQAWLDSPARNQGLILANASVSDDLAFASSEAAVDASHPRLTIRYLPPS